jgi:hypothetical protein
MEISRFLQGLKEIESGGMCYRSGKWEVFMTCFDGSHEPIEPLNAVASDHPGEPTCEVLIPCDGDSDSPVKTEQSASAAWL